YRNVTGVQTCALPIFAVRAVVAWRRGQLRDYVRVVRSAEWLLDTARLAVASGVFVFAYGWIKLAVPLLHGRLFDQELWDLDAKQIGRASCREREGITE